MIKFTQTTRSRAGYTMSIRRGTIAQRATERLPNVALDFKKPRPHQIDAANIPGRFVEVNFPPRDGKTMCQALRGVREGIATRWNQRQLAVVPQNLIGKGFASSRFVLDGQKWEWKAKNADDLCNGHGGRKGDRLVELLGTAGPFHPIPCGDVKTVSDLNGVTSTQAFAQFWKYDLKGRVRTRYARRRLIRSTLFQNITVWLDEAHHVRELDNIIGDFVAFAVRYGSKSLRVVLATATPYNSTVMLDEATKKKFKSVKRSFSDYLETVATGIQKAVVTPVTFDGRSPVDTLVQEIKSAGPGRFHLVFIPPDGTFWRRKKLHTFALVRMFARKLRSIPWVKVLDATTHEGGRTLTAMQGDSAIREDYNVVIACRRGREGLDWTPADFLHVLYMQSQLWEANQVFTRPFSNYRGKRRVDVRYYIEAQGDVLDRFDNLVLTMRLALEQMEFIAPTPLVARIPEAKRRKITDALLRSRAEDPVEDVCAEYGNDPDTVEYVKTKFIGLVLRNFGQCYTGKAYVKAKACFRKNGRNLLEVDKKTLAALRSQDGEFEAFCIAYKMAVKAGAL